MPRTHSFLLHPLELLHLSPHIFAEKTCSTPILLLLRPMYHAT